MMGLAASLLLLLGLTGSVYEDTYRQGLEAYEQGRMEEAAEAFEKLTASGVADAALFTNLGNSYHGQNRPGLAVLNYERALRVHPGFEMAEVHLERVLGETQRRLERPPGPMWEQSLLFWHGALPLGWTLAGAMAAWLTGWGLLGLRLWRPLPMLRRGAALAMVLAAALGLSAWVKSHPPPLGVTVVERAPVRYGWGEDEAVRFELFEGDRVRLERREGPWVRVSTAGDERGWTRAMFLAPVGPPYTPPPPAQTSNEER